MTPLALLTLSAAGCVALPPEADAVLAAHLAGAVPLFAAAAPDAVVGFAPAPGVRRTFAAAELRRIAERLGLEGEVPAVCVERTLAPLASGRLLEAMQRSLPGARIEIADWSRYQAPAGDLDFPAAGLQPSGLWHGWVRYGKARRFAVWARVRVLLSRSEVIALEPLRAGQPIAASQVKLETVEGPPAAGGARAASLEEVVGRLPRRAVPRGAAVLRSLLALAPEVARGETVKVEVRQGSARLEIEAKAEADGRLGERIPFLNPDSKRRFVARVDGKGRASAGEGERQ